MDCNDCYDVMIKLRFYGVKQMKHKECNHPWQYVEVGYDHINMCIKSICHKCGKIIILKT